MSKNSSFWPPVHTYNDNKAHRLLNNLLDYRYKLLLDNTLLNLSIDPLNVNNYGEDDVNYEDNKIGPDVIILLSNIIENNTSLEEITITNAQIEEDYIKILLKAIRYNRSIKKLTLTYVTVANINNVYSLAIKKLLKYNDNITYFKLIFGRPQINPNIDYKDINKNENVFYNICKGLAGNTSVKTLDLSDNRITNSDAYNIATMLTFNKTIRKLNLSQCRMSETAVSYISQSLPDVEYSDTDYLYNKRLEIRKNAAQNDTLRSLNISYNGQLINDYYYLSHSIIYSFFAKSLEKLYMDRILINFRNVMIYDDNNKLPMSNLRTLSLNHTSGISSIETYTQELSIFVKLFSKLYSIKLNNNTIGSAQSVIIIDLLSSSNIHKIDLSYNELIRFDGKTILQNKNIEWLNLQFQWSNRMIPGPNGVDIAEGVGINLHTLIEIFECLPDNYTLKHLNIADNQINNYDVINNLAENLKLNHALESLDLSHNAMPEDAIDDIIDMSMKYPGGYFKDFI